MRIDCSGWTELVGRSEWAGDKSCEGCRQLLSGTGINLKLNLNLNLLGSRSPVLLVFVETQSSAAQDCVNCMSLI